MKKLHLGCGSILIDGWINIDLDSPVADLQHDLTKPLPFSDGSVSHIFAEHLIEHIEHAQAQSLLEECWRVLEPGGVLRLTTPDLRWLATVYLASLTHLWGELWQPASPCAMLNEGMRAWGHKYLYDSAELHAMLSNRGFVDVTEHAWRESDDPVLAGLESRTYNHELIVQASKGGGEPQCAVRYERRSSMPEEEVIDRLLLEQGRKLQDNAVSLAACHADNARLRSLAAALESEVLTVRDLRTRESLLVEEARKLREVIVDREAAIDSAQREKAESVDWARLLQEEAGRRGERIAFLEGIVNDLTAHVEGLDAEIALRGDSIAGLTAEVALRGALIAELTADTERRAAVLEERQRRIAELDDRCVEQVAAIDALTEEVTSKTRVVEEQAGTLSRIASSYLGRWLLRRSSKLK